MTKHTLVNNQIRAKEVRLIDEAGKQVGLLPLEEALSFAKSKGFDLIQVTERVDPPVCKLGNYGKFLYQQGKKERKAGQQKASQLKEVRLTLGISVHDMGTRAKQAKEFLARGDTVRIAMRLRGREKAMGKFAQEKVESFLEMIRAFLPITLEREPRMEPSGLSLIITKK
ncbi:MAG: translation initiation factor IF-3 [Candidatus Wildermuthbacteria bacterium]|nr:translation initiation factor IF-3 [Candidatus Wildermuthbacteria bacterium]